MELKLDLSQDKNRSMNSSNCTFMELKLWMHVQWNMEKTVLIVPLWH